MYQNKERDIILEDRPIANTVWLCDRRCIHCASAPADLTVRKTKEAASNSSRRLSRVERRISYAYGNPIRCSIYTSAPFKRTEKDNVSVSANGSLVFVIGEVIFS